MSEPSSGHSWLHHTFVAELLAGCGRHCLKFLAFSFCKHSNQFSIKALRYVDNLQGKTMSEPSGGHACLHHTFVAELFAGCGRHCLKLPACRSLSRKFFLYLADVPQKVSFVRVCANIDDH